MNNPRDKSKQDRLDSIAEIVLRNVAEVESVIDPAAPVIAAAKVEKRKLNELTAALQKGTPSPVCSHFVLFSLLNYLI